LSRATLTLNSFRVRSIDLMCPGIYEDLLR
jgi:hypothetical protein